MSALPPFLSDGEILEIVTPLVQPAAIVRWFRDNGFPDVKKRPNGMPLVSRAYFDQVTAGSAKKADIHGPEIVVQPNVQAYLDRFAKSAKSKPVRQKV
jgi:hypothetical protein